jgi:formyl-CoA transferase
MDGRDIALDAHLRARGFLKEIRLPDGSPYPTGGLPWVMEGLVPPERLVQPEMGEHTREVLSSVLGLPGATLDELEALDVTRQTAF